MGAPLAAAARAVTVARTIQHSTPPAPAPHKGRGPRAIAALVICFVVVPTLIVVVILGGAQLRPECADPGALPGSWTGPGSLGGVSGTGVTPAELAAARRIPGLGGTRLTPGSYSPTAYFPHPNAPSTNCGATCISTASGIKVNNATRRAYLIASNPQLNQYGALAYVWPNPYGWTGPFVVADTGSAFRGVGRLDFYIFIDTGQTWQQALAKAYEWGPANRVTVSATAIQPGGPTITTPTPTDSAAAGASPPGCGVAADSELSGQIAQIAARHVGAGPNIAGFEPPTTSLAWCAWFASNVWRQAGVAIAITWASNDLYTWGAAHRTLFKAVGSAPRGRTPPLGSAVLYGSGPQSTATSHHLNLVSKVNADGSFMLIGGNESNRVGLSGPCRLTGGAQAHLTGPGCDSRPVYGIAAPGAAT